MSSDIRNPNSILRTSTSKPVNILDDQDDPTGPSATTQLTTSSSTKMSSLSHNTTPTSGVEARIAVKARAPIAMGEDISEVSHAHNPSQASIRPPSTGLAAPTSPLAASSTSPRIIAGATSFAHALEDVRYSGHDSDAMTSAFMKLDSSNLSTNDQMESYTNQALHYLRVAAANILNGLAKENPDDLLNQADQLEHQGLAMLGEGAGATEDPEAAGRQILESVDQKQAWKTLFDDASSDIGKAQSLYEQAQAAKAAGDMDKYHELYNQADELSGKAHTILESAGIRISNADAYELGRLSAQMKAEGKTGNVMTEFLNEHPEKAKALLPADIYNQVKDKGGQAIVDAIMDYQASLVQDNGELAGVALATGGLAASPEAMAQLMAENPQLANNPMAGAAAGVLAQAWDLKMRAYMIQEAKIDAQNAVDEGHTQQGQFGVQMRNQEGNAIDLRHLFALTSGTRPDQQLREDRTAAASKAKSDVLRLMRDQLNLQATRTSGHSMIRT